MSVFAEGPPNLLASFLVVEVNERNRGEREWGEEEGSPCPCPPFSDKPSQTKSTLTVSRRYAKLGGRWRLSTKDAATHTDGGIRQKEPEESNGGAREFSSSSSRTTKISSAKAWKSFLGGAL